MGTWIYDSRGEGGSMSMGRRQAKQSDEYDVVTDWRRFLCYMKRAGVVSKIKRRMRRRERHDARREIRRDWL